MTDTTKTAPVFNLAITMAGAGSAGCFTGGVMDYLFELLDKWEKAKDGNDPFLKDYKDLVPRHQVVIDAMGGTSAGGMTTSMSAIYALNGKINPVTEPGKFERKNNIFYDSWVLMDDDNPKRPGPLFKKVWETDDLDSGRIGSLLNSNFIDNIADSAFEFMGDVAELTSKLPPYISKNLQLLYSHCLLRGIPLELNFETAIAKSGRKSVIPNHTTFEHYFISHYHLNGGQEPNPDEYLWLNPYAKPAVETMKLSTKATGAFPAGLLYREFGPEQFSEGYVKTIMKRIITGEFGKANPDPDDKIELKYIPSAYSSITIDGGAINNEPYREVLSILRGQYGETPSDGYPRYGVIMIDPFPDRAQLAAPYDRPNDMVDALLSLVGTMTDQARIKRREMLEADESKYFRSIIFPRKWKKGEKEGSVMPEPVAIACASGMAFGGLLDAKFREHDFFLGRNNARNFFRFFFSFPYNDGSADPAARVVHPIHEHWTPAMVDAFKIEKDGQTYLPIIPDMNYLVEQKTGTVKGRFENDIPTMPLYDPEHLFKLKDAMKKRFKRMIQLGQQRDFSAIKAKALEEQFKSLPPKKQELARKELELQRQRAAAADLWLEGAYPQSWLSKIGSALMKPLQRIGMSIAVNVIASKMTKKAMDAILKDLAAKGLLKAPDQ